MKHTNKILPIIVVFVLVGTIIWATRTEAPEKANQNNQIVDQVNTSGWLVSSDQGFSFMHPTDTGTKYIHTIDWPPKIQIVEGPFNCVEAGQEIERAGQTELINIGQNQYCATTVSEGAAGSVYNQYAYEKSLDGKNIILTFSLRFVQCYNYDDPERAKCLAERDKFNPGVLIDQIFKTLK